MFVCKCNGVTDQQIIDAVDQGARTLQDLGELVGAGICCGGCHEYAQYLIDERLDVSQLAYSAG